MFMSRQWGGGQLRLSDQTVSCLHVLSEDAVRTRVPWGLKDTLLISPSWPIRVCVHTPVMLLYTRAVPSALALTNLEPDESNETSRTCNK